MRQKSLQYLRSLILPICTAGLAVSLFGQPAVAETSPHATTPDGSPNTARPAEFKGLAAQPQPVYPDGPPDQSAADPASPESSAQSAETDPTGSDPDQRASLPTIDELREKLKNHPELERATSDDPDIEVLNGDGEAEPDSAAEIVEPKTPIIVANVDKTTQEMTVFVDGVETYRWPVSTGLPGYATPGGSFTASSMNEIWYSRQWNNAPMPHAVFFTKKGHAIHATNETKKLGRPASHGCIRLSPKNAETFFNLVKEKGLERTEVVLTGYTPGGDYKMAHPERRYDPYESYGRPAYPRYRNYRRYGYNEIQPRVQRKRRRARTYYQPQPRRYRRAPRRGNWFRAPGY